MEKYTRENLIESLEFMINNLKYGCGNHGCLINPPKGQGTNMICHCDPLNISKKLLKIALAVERMENKW